MTKPTCADLARLAGISRGSACDILNGKRRPSLQLAVHMFRCTGWRHARIAGASEADLDAIERVEGRYVPHGMRSGARLKSAA